MAGVDPIWADEHGGAAFPGHGPVVGVPVVVLAAGSGEDLSEQQAKPFGAGPGSGIVRPGRLGVSFDCRTASRRGTRRSPGAGRAGWGALPGRWRRTPERARRWPGEGRRPR